MTFQTPTGPGAVLALIGLVIVLILIIIGQISAWPVGVLWLLAFLARLT